MGLLEGYSALGDVAEWVQADIGLDMCSKA